MKKFLLMMMGMLLVLPSFARDFSYTYQGQTLTYTVIDEGAKTCKTKAGSNDPKEAGNNVEGVVVIPAQAGDGTTVYKVTSIGDAAFLGCSNLTSISIPESVTSIGKEAFNECNSLQKAEFVSIESLCKINFDNKWANPLRYAHHLYINGKEVTEVVIPEGITSIGKNTFAGGRSLTSISIPEGVTSIGELAFMDCSGLTSIIIPESITSIGEEAFAYCSGLTSITIPESVTSISIGTFEGCNSLASITIPGSVTEIGEFAFYSCRSLTSFSIPESVTSIGSYAFMGCSGLTSISIPKRVTYIGVYAFGSCTSLTSITIPKGVNFIGGAAFQNCSGLTSVYYGADNPISCDAYIFSPATYEKATLYMTKEGVRVSSTIDPWKKFKNIQVYDFNSGIDAVLAEIDTDAPYEVYNLNGVKVGCNTDALSTGIYIIRQGNKVKKITVK